MSQNFKINTSNYIGFEYKKYLNEVKGLALTDPKVYAKARNDAVEGLTDQMSKDWYEKIYKVLSEGKYVKADGSVAEVVKGKMPSYPQQELAKIALSHTQTIVDMMDEVVELLLPEKYLSTAMEQLEAKRSIRGIN